MTDRKPGGMSYESWIDRQIREATDRGDFDNLPGAGKPLPDMGSAGIENWWMPNYLRREGVSTEALLPTSLQLRKEIERLPDTVRELRSEQEVRELVAELNQRIVDCWRTPVAGPQVTLLQVTVDDVVAQWRAARSTADEEIAPAAQLPHAPDPGRSGWWRRIAGKRARSR
jgi:hypothetical protein